MCLDRKLQSCPHLLLCGGRPGEIRGGALSNRLQRLWQIVVEHVGDDPLEDRHGAYRDAWGQLRIRYAAAADLTVDGDDWTAIIVADPARMDAVVEACISADEL